MRGQRGVVESFPAGRSPWCCLQPLLCSPCMSFQPQPEAPAPSCAPAKPSLKRQLTSGTSLPPPPDPYLQPPGLSPGLLCTLHCTSSSGAAPGLPSAGATLDLMTWAESAHRSTSGAEQRLPGCHPAAGLLRHSSTPLASAPLSVGVSIGTLDVNSDPCRNKPGL